MKKNWIILLTALTLLSLLLGACQRSASQAPVAKPTSTGEMPFPVVTQVNPLDDVIMSTQYAMETAAAAGGAEPTDEATATPEPTKFPTATPGVPSSYTLQKGEFPYCIARRFNVNVVDLLNLNGLSVNSVVNPGAVLKIPQNSQWSTSAHGARALHAHGGTHTVQSNETIYSIACYYGDVDPNAIIAANGLEKPYTVKTGQELIIP